MTQIWYASERMNQGMKISALINETIIKISVYEFKRQGLEMEFDSEVILKEAGEAKAFLETLLISIAAIEEGGKRLFMMDPSLKYFTTELIRRRAGNRAKLEEDIKNAIGELGKIQSNNPFESKEIYPLLNELYYLAINTVDQNKELILTPTG